MLKEKDRKVLKLIGDIIVEQDNRARCITGKEILDKAEELSEEELELALENLEHYKYLKRTFFTGGLESHHIYLSLLGFCQYCNSFIKDFKQIIKEMKHKIKEGQTSEEISSELSIGVKPVIVEAILEQWENEDYIRLNKSLNPRQIIMITPRGKEYFAE